MKYFVKSEFFMHIQNFVNDCVGCINDPRFCFYDVLAQKKGAKWRLFTISTNCFYFKISRDITTL